MGLIKKFLFQAVGAFLALFLAVKFVPRVELTGPWQVLIWAALLLSFINLFLKPLLNFITFPLKILTLGLIPLSLNMAIVWFLDIVFPELKIIGLLPLFLTTLIVWSFALFFARLAKSSKRRWQEVVEK